MSPPPKISVVVPVYNEHDNIAPCLRRLHAELAAIPHEILVCYDFDEDTTLAAIRAMPDAPPTLRLVKNTLGRGAAFALRAGFAAADGDVVVTSMADLSDTPESIPRMAALLRGRDLAVVAGSRYMDGGSQSGGPFLKRTFSRVAGVSLDWIAGIGTSDATTNFRAYSKRFLESVTVESRSGFEIALELTVKAHLAGRGVGEVPASWTDRSAGESRFRMWKWMPNYLGWWFRAAWQPLLVWAVFAACFCVSFARATTAQADSGLGEALVLAFGAIGVGLVLVARRARGRTIAADVVLAALWTLPLPTGRIVGTCICLGVTPGITRLRAWLWPAVHSLLSNARQGHVGLAVLTLALWLAHVTSIEPTAARDLDASWQQVLGWGLTNQVQFGPELAFTFGPLGYFARGTYAPELFWWHQLWWEIGFKLLLSAWLVTGVHRLRERPLEAFLLVVALFVCNSGFDGFYLTSILAITTWMIENPGGKSGRTALGLATLWTIGLVKFTSFAVAGACLAVVALHRARVRSWGDAGRFAGAAMLVLVLLWSAIGQAPWNLPLFVVRGLQISAGYNEAMARLTSLPVQVAGLWTLSAVFLGVTLFLAARFRNPTAVASAAIVLVVVSGAFKAAFTMQSALCPTFFCLASLALLFLVGEARGGASSRALAFRCVAASRIGLGVACLAASSTIFALWRSPERPDFGMLMAGTLNDAILNVENLARFESTRSALESERGQLRNDQHLPAIVERVGSAPIDIWTSEQGILLLNGLNYRPRPVFQGYAAYTPALMRANERFFASDRAPQFVVFQLGSIDERLPTMDDALALARIFRDYRPVLTELEYILLERLPAPQREGGDAPAVLLERTIEVEEEVDVTRFDRPILLSLDIRYKLRGRWTSALLRAPVCKLRVRFLDGNVVDFRIVPAAMRADVLLDPLLGGFESCLAWLTGEVRRNVRSFAVVYPDGRDSGFSPEIGLCISDATSWVPPRNAELSRGLEMSMFDAQPVEVYSAFSRGRAIVEGRPVLVVHAPSELRFELEAGAQVVRAEYGIMSSAWTATTGGRTDGVRFVVSSRDASKHEKVLVDRWLDPVAVEQDRGLQRLELDIGADQPRTLLLRTRPGTAGDATCDWAYWTGLKIEPR